MNNMSSKSFCNPINRTIRLKMLALLLMAHLAVPIGMKAEKGAERLKSKPQSKPAARQEEKKTETPKGDEEKPFDEVVKEMEVLKGLFSFYRKAEDNSTLMEILPEQLDKTFLFAGKVDPTGHKRGIYAPHMGGSFPPSSTKVGKNIQRI